jgi:hypothetical protein
MCTVTFIPTKDQLFLTSNRDERWWRPSAFPPRLTAIANYHMLFPVDTKGNGTWICLCSNGNAGVLLNGAFTPHIRKDKYRMSRGLALLDIMNSDHPIWNFFTLSLDDIEPFTLILWQDNKLYECRWDEHSNRHCRLLTCYRPYIWSSTTLYDAVAQSKREGWFKKWLLYHPIPTQEEVLNFHRFTGSANKQDGLCMNRGGKVFTVSITSIAITPKGGTMKYIDLQSFSESSSEIYFHSTSLRA